MKTVIFFFCLLTSYQVFAKILETILNKQKGSYLDYYVVASLFLWSLFYYLTNTN